MMRKNDAPIAECANRMQACMLLVVLALALFAAVILMPSSAAAQGLHERYNAWENGPPADETFFPIGVWLQSPHRAQRYKDAGFNMYVGLWQGPTEDQLSQLSEAGMAVICHQNEIGLAHIDNPLIYAWMHDDEPDNAQWNSETSSYDPPIEPSVIQEDYARMKAADPSRPVYLNLGQGVAYDDYIGRGVRRNHPEDYAEYMKGTDIVSFDIYPVNSSYDAVKDQLWRVSYGVRRLIDWSDDAKIVWNFIECTDIRGNGKPTPAQMRYEVWSSIIRGSTGILYFAHQIEPFLEYALLTDDEMLAAVTNINTGIQALAPVLNSPSVEGRVIAESSSPYVSMETTVREYDEALYVFSATFQNKETMGTFTIDGLSADAMAEVIGEDRTIEIADGVFTDMFEGYGVHLYRIAPVDVGVEQTGAPASFALLGNAPNPFNPVTTIRYELSQPAHVKLSIYSVSGQKVATLADTSMNAGVYTAVFNGAELSSGVYICCLEADGVVKSGKMVLVR